MMKPITSKNINDHRDSQGNTQLHYSIDHDLRTVQLLLNLGAEVNVQNEFGDTPLQIACHSGYKDIATELIKHGALLNSRNEFGETALFKVCKDGNSSIAKLLITHGADVNVANYDGITPLMFCADHSYLSMFADDDLSFATTIPDDRFIIFVLLLEHGADVNRCCINENTALHYACINRHYSVTKLLLKNNANVNAQNFEGNTPLHIAVKRSALNTTQLLLAVDGIDTLCKNDLGQTPLDLAPDSLREEFQLLFPPGLHTKSARKLQNFNHEQQ